ncbi:Hsp20/alpha crystallin family protein [Chloroflexi bacterium TSY]|nr:Hsp20/alpha crystallin family protein [Chloroflexi bacterium TSY]
MTTLTRWDPFREMATLRNSLDRFFDEPFFESHRLWPWRLDEFTPAVDVSEEENAYVVKASVPGVNPDDVEVTISDNVLMIKGESKEEKEVDEKNYHLRERRFGSFSRSLTLPMAVEADKVEATHDNGVLHLRLPKSEEVKPKKIAIKAGSNGKG